MNELAYALITPYSLLKSRTGGIIGRLMAISKLTLVGVRMFIFSDEFMDAYTPIVCPPDTEPSLAQAWQRYVTENLRRSNPWGHVPRCMVLLFSGSNALRHLKDEVLGGFGDQITGDTVRGTYGDFIRDADGRIRYFEPAVITGPDPDTNRQHLKLLADFSARDGGILTGRCSYPPGSKLEIALVILKPDNFERPTRRPGNIIDVFSRTGLRIVGTRLFNMTVAQAEEFYGPLKEDFKTRLRPHLTQEIYSRLHDAFAFPFTMVDAERVAEFLAPRNAVAEFNRIVEFMTGVNPEEIADPDMKGTASRSKCLAMLYEGPDAVSKIRRHLGSTDPNKAEPATVRSEFGKDLMRNGAHASDSAISAVRERKIVDMWEEQGATEFERTIRAHLENA